MKSVFLFLFSLSVIACGAQDLFSLELVPSSLTAPPAVHSGAFGEYQGKWFFIGGRKNGLHGFQPPFSFPTSGRNDSIFIVDPALNQRWSADVFTLADSIREAITSSNMEFYLQDSTLYMVGGYGWKDSIQNFITWPTLTAINIKGLSAAVISGAPIQSYFRQIQDTNLAICGAHLQKLDSVYYLVFGHRFDGYYDRSDTTGFHVQMYSNEIRKFQIADDGVNLSLYNYHAVRDTANFRRRDYNLIPFYNPWKGNGLLAYSGVFRKGIDLPYFNLIEIYPDTFIVRNDFNQTLSQYHSAVCPLYDSVNAINHDVFFGGMSMYYVDSIGATVTDSMVPFVRTISDVARDVDENYHELNAGITMPALLGTNAYFFMDAAVPTYKSFVHVNKLGNHTRIGYICGGIESPDMNINSTDPSLSFASARVFEVYTNKATGFGKEVVNDVLDFYCYPNPATRQSEVCFELNKVQTVKVSLFDVNGRLVTEVCNKEFTAGKQKLLLNMSDYPKGVYNVAITVNNRLKSIRLVHQ